MTPDELSAVYEDLHRHPELAFQEVRTARVVAQHLAGVFPEVVTGLAGTGVAGVLRNGDGPTVLLRADMDGLPVREETGLPYASTADADGPDGTRVPVMHACGHDVHVTCLLGAADVLAARRDEWSGTLVALFQPAEESAGGARALVDDGLYARVPRPDVVLGQHVGPMPAGAVFHRSGALMASSDTLRVVFHGVGGHGARPDLVVDPITMAASFVLKVQGLVPRTSVAPFTSVLTVGAVLAGSAGNVVPATAEVRMTLRTFEPEARERLLAAVRRVAQGEALAADAPREPEVHVEGTYPMTVNDPGLMARLVAGFVEHLGPQRVHEVPPVTASEDVAVLAEAAGASLGYWFIGGVDPAVFAAAQGTGGVPGNHSPQFAPVPRPTLATGVDALVTAVLTLLG